MAIGATVDGFSVGLAAVGFGEAHGFVAAAFDLAQGILTVAGIERTFDKNTVRLKGFVGKLRHAD